MFRDAEPAPINASLVELMQDYRLVAALPRPDLSDYAEHFLKYSKSLAGRTLPSTPQPHQTSFDTRLDYAFPPQPNSHWEAIQRIVNITQGIQQEEPLLFPLRSESHQTMRVIRVQHPGDANVVTTQVKCDVPIYQCVNPDEGDPNYILRSSWKVTSYADTCRAINDARDLWEKTIAIGQIRISSGWMYVSNGDVMRFSILDNAGNRLPWISSPGELLMTGTPIGELPIDKVFEHRSLEELRQEFDISIPPEQSGIKAIRMDPSRLEELAALLSQHI